MHAARLLLAAALLAAAGSADARDDRLMLSIAEAMKTPAAREKLDPRIRLYFGNKRPSVARSIGTWTTNKKTSAFGRSDKDVAGVAFRGEVAKIAR